MVCHRIRAHGRGGIGLGGAEVLLDGDQVPRGQRPDPPVAARHVIGRLLDLSHVSWRTCVADQLSDHNGQILVYGLPCHGKLDSRVPPHGLRGVRVSRTQLVVGAPVALAVSRFEFAKLRRLRPRPVALAAVPAGMPRMLCSESYGPGLEEIVLAYGYPFPVHKPLIEVETCFSQEQPSSTALEQVIARAEYRDSCYADLRWEDVVEPFGGSQDVPVPARSLDRRDQAVTVDGEERSVVVVSYGSYAALRFHRDTVTVTAVARLGFPATLAFQTTDDLEPYFAGYTRFVLSWLRPSSW